MSVSRQQIADVFARHVDEVGYGKATLDDVAREMRISKKTIYVHFDGKREIYEYIVERHAARERVRLQTAVEQLPTYAEKIHALLGFVLGAVRQRMAETGEEGWMQEFEIAGDAFKKAHGDLLRDLVSDGMSAGEFLPGDAELVEKMVAAMVIEYLLMVNVRPEYDRDEELLERILRFIA